jgi:TolB protein
LYTRDANGSSFANGRQLDARIYTQRLDGTGVIEVTISGSSPNAKIPGTNDINPRYSPDGYSIIFINQANDNLTPGDVWTIEATGANRQKQFTNAALPDYK